MPEPKTTEIEKGLFNKITGTYQSLKEIWFGPGKPAAPAAQETKGRRFDYPTGYNLNYAPRKEEAISFADLRGLADGCNILRVLLTRRKNQICGIPWNIKVKNDKDEQGKSIEIDEATKNRLDECKKRWQRPDGVRPFVTWLRQLLEDWFVLDALCVEPRRNYGGQVIAHDVVDGATINIKLDVKGRIPAPPDVAFQQYLKGVPANDLTTEDLCYGMSEPRTWKVYGFSPVEQIIMIVNMALRRDVHKLQYYTEGTLPDIIVQTPETWDGAAVMEAEETFNKMLEGNTAARRKAKFVPHGGVTELKSDILKDQFDEWLARIIAYAFGLSPAALVQMMNRAQSESIQEATREEALEFPLIFLKSYFDTLIQVYEGNTDFEFVWEQEKILDAQTRANVDAIAQDKGWKSLDDIRKEQGKDPVGVGVLITTPTGIFTPEQIKDGVVAAPAEEMFSNDADAIIQGREFQGISRAVIANIQRRKKK